MGSVSKIRFTGTFALGAMAAGAIASAGLVAAPTANATCVSAFGIGNSADCRSNLFSTAVAIGNGARAYADGQFGAALSFGSTAYAETGSAFNFAVTAGSESSAITRSLFGIAANVGDRGSAGVTNFGQKGSLGLNIAVNVAPPAVNNTESSAFANGMGNIAVSLSRGDSTATAFGLANTAANLGGKSTSVFTGFDPSSFSTAFNVFSTGNTVRSGPGPFAGAVSVFYNQDVTKEKPGININGIRVPNTAAAVNPNKKASKPSPAAATGTQRDRGSDTARGGSR